MKLLVSLAYVLIYVFSLLFCDIYSVFTRQPYSILKFASLPLANTYYILIIHVYRHMRMCLYLRPPLHESTCALLRYDAWSRTSSRDVCRFFFLRVWGPS